MNGEGKFLVNGVLQEDAFIGWVEDTPRLFVKGVAVKGTLKDLGLREEVYAVATIRIDDEKTGELILKVLLNG